MIPKCRFCDELAVASFSMSEGCICYPDEKEQNRCMHHILRDGMYGEVKVIKIYNQVLADQFNVRLDEPK